MPLRVSRTWTIRRSVSEASIARRISPGYARSFGTAIGVGAVVQTGPVLANATPAPATATATAPQTANAASLMNVQLRLSDAGDSKASDLRPQADSPRRSLQADHEFRGMRAPVDR